MDHTRQFGCISSNTHKMKKTKIIQPELILTHSLRQNAPSQVEFFSIVFFKRVGDIKTC